MIKSKITILPATTVRDFEFNKKNKSKINLLHWEIIFRPDLLSGTGFHLIHPDLF